MNNRYLQIIATCLIVGTITLAMKQKKCSCPCITEENNSQIINAAVETQTDAGLNTITITPQISDENLAYSYGPASYSPKEIALYVNDKEIEIGNDKPITIDIDGNKVRTRCEYKFVAGFYTRAGESDSTWDVEPGKNYPVTFDWKTEEKIQIKGAKSSSAKE